MSEDEGTDGEDIETYDETRRKQVRKVLLVGALPLLALALLCIINITFWVIGYKTPQTANLRDWFVLIAASAMLIGILFFLSLVSYALLKNRRTHIQKKLVRTTKKSRRGELEPVYYSRIRG